MSAEESEPYEQYGPPPSGSATSRLDWVLEETTRSRRFLGAMVVDAEGAPIAQRGFDQPELVASLAPECSRLVSRLKEGLPPQENNTGRTPGEAISFAGFGQPAEEAAAPEYTAISLGRERKLLFRPLEVQGKTLTLVLLSQALSSNTDAVLEGISRAVSTSLTTDWSQAAEG